VINNLLPSFKIPLLKMFDLDNTTWYLLIRALLCESEGFFDKMALQRV
jgi:hypothetical protein